MEQRYRRANTPSGPQDLVINFCGTSTQILAHILPSLTCVCGLRGEIQAVMTASVLKIDKLRSERAHYKQLLKDHKVIVKRLRDEINDWEKNYCLIRQTGNKRTEPCLMQLDSKVLSEKTFEEFERTSHLSNILKEISLKQQRDQNHQRVPTESEICLQELKYSNTILYNGEESFLLQDLCERGSPQKRIRTNLR